MTESQHSTGDLQRVGGCRCGHVAVFAAGEALQVSYCHCSDCRKASGAPVSLFVGFPNDRVRIEGEMTHYHNDPVSRGFCPTCGAPIVFDDTRLDSRWLMIGVFDDPERFVPEMHAFFSEHLDWFDTTDTLPRHERFTVMRERS